MSTITATRRRRRFGVAGIAAAAAIGAASLMPAASAAPVDLVAPLTGTLDIDGTVATIPDGTTFTGTWDDETFEFEGDLDFPAIVTTVSVTDPLETDVDVTLQINQVTAMSGSWDPDTGDAIASAELEVQITDLYVHLLDQSLPVPDTCVFGPIVLDLTGTATEDADGNTALTLGPDSFAIPAAAAEACGDLTEAISGALSGDNNLASVNLSFAPDQDIPTPTTTTVPAETTTTEAPADPADPPAAGGTATPATPVAATPSYTG